MTYIRHLSLQNPLVHLGRNSEVSTLAVVVVAVSRCVCVFFFFLFAVVSFQFLQSSIKRESPKFRQILRGLSYMAGAAGSWEAGSSQAIKTSARAPRAADSSSHDGDCATSKDSQHMGLQSHSMSSSVLRFVLARD
ncbi:hypothetical protein GE21DRAFT_1037960 [Neurospora crassa]|nr:hypothetical protein GE21DRAFT_1037960 [Neurospora crassa]